MENKITLTEEMEALLVSVLIMHRNGQENSMELYKSRANEAKKKGQFISEHSNLNMAHYMQQDISIIDSILKQL